MKTFQQNYITKDMISKELEKFIFQPYTFHLYKQTKSNKLINEVLSHFKMIILKQGSFQLSSSGKTYQLTIPGTILILEPLVLFELEFGKQEEVEFYYMDFDVTPTSDSHEIASLLRPHQICIIENIHNDLTLSILEVSEREYSQRSAGNYFMLKALLEYLMALVWNAYINRYRNLHPLDLGKTPQEQIVLKCILHLNQNIHRYVSVNELCQIVNVSQSYLYQCFMATLSCSTKDFITNYKLKRIAYDLVQSQLSIEELAMKYGYTSIYSFSTTFKKFYGISPLKFRKEGHLKDSNDSI